MGQGVPIDTGGYWKPCPAKTSAAMRPSPTFNAIIPDVAGTPMSALDPEGSRTVDAIYDTTREKVAVVRANLGGASFRLIYLTRQALPDMKPFF